MSDESGQTNGMDGTAAWSKAWFDLMGRMTAAGSSISAETPPPAAARQMREAFFKAMSAQADEYMRSPQFLAMMKSSMDSAALAWRSQLNEFLRQAYRESRVPSQDDIEDLAGRVQLFQRHVTQRLEAIEQQLGAIYELLKPAAPLLRPGTSAKRSRGHRNQPGNVRNIHAGNP